MHVKIIMLVLLLATASCKKFLDEKTDKKLVIASTLQDAQALLDAYDIFNIGDPMAGDVSSDDYYLLPAYWNGLSQNNRLLYIWDKEALADNDWRNMYQRVLNANIALEIVNKIQPAPAGINDWKRIKGAALFCRAWAFAAVAHHFAPPYDKQTAPQRPGIPLRLNSNSDVISTRASLEQTWQQVIADFEQAAALLPLTTSPVSRPSKAAAFAALARTYLTMDEFESAGKYADSALLLNNTLIDYNSVNTGSSTPFSLFNVEVIYPSALTYSAMTSVNNGRVDSLLYLGYDTADCRRKVFFQSNGTNTVGFKGSYDPLNGLFSGLSVNEMYLIKAECLARLGNVVGAMSTLNTLLEKRWKTGSFVPFVASDAQQALQRVLKERRKELIGRGLRWLDLRRLNKYPAYAVTLIRNTGSQQFSLLPNDDRYTFPIPLSVIEATGMQQNER